MNLYKLNLKLFVIILTFSNQISLISSELNNSKKTQNNLDNIDSLIQEDFSSLKTFQKEIIVDNVSEESDYVIPKNSAIVVSNLMEIVLDPDRKYPMPITLVTKLPVYSKSGKELLPKKTLISGLIETRPGGDYISISGAVYKGLKINIPAEGKLIPAQIRPENYGQYITPPPTKNASVFRSIGDSYLITTLLGVSIANSYNDDGGNREVPGLMLGILGLDLGIRAIATLSDRGPEKIPPLVEIRRNTVIIFETVDDIFLPNLSSPKTTLGGSHFQEY
tara:strand:+ start:2675 stop:3508 length:834 start_codon:yes stop_codon:yes gene_type:complete